MAANAQKGARSSSQSQQGTQYNFMQRLIRETNGLGPEIALIYPPRTVRRPRPPSTTVWPFYLRHPSRPSETSDAMTPPRRRLFAGLCNLSAPRSYRFVI